MLAYKAPVCQKTSEALTICSRLTCAGPLPSLSNSFRRHCPWAVTGNSTVKEDDFAQRVNINRAEAFRPIPFYGSLKIN